ncbi:urease accessory protein UreD [Marinobacterium nitratireducens]|uniref:Urease accessory protein UreD n=1 Tax=Marinobacterium nitratireducens TaxID=518897 RepID=A0A917ZHG1_9GAMM|nr:urease accessory protein UreD [Marinobacterium nitratireducens]GGO82074.1 urease accessory protein UreD [Marinobacterium nitratireducens]
MDMAVPETRGWQARLELGFEARFDKTRLKHRRQRGPLAVQRPFYPEYGVCHCYLLHPPGGVVGGDELEIDVHVASGAQALITTPGATKFYRSAGLSALQTQHLRVEAGASLEWLPQENIYFPAARSRLRSRVDIAEGGRFIGWELHCLGRPANGERFDTGTLDSRAEFWLDGRRVLIDQLQVSGDDQFSAAAGMRGHAMAASLCAAPAGQAELDAVQALIEERFAALPVGATLVDGVLAVRMLGQNTECLQATLIPVWELLRQRLLGLAPCPPRIWAT